MNALSILADRVGRFYCPDAPLSILTAACAVTEAGRQVRFGKGCAIVVTPDRVEIFGDRHPVVADAPFVYPDTKIMVRLRELVATPESVIYPLRSGFERAWFLFVTTSDKSVAAADLRLTIDPRRLEFVFNSKPVSLRRTALFDDDAIRTPQEQLWSSRLAPRKGTK